MNEYESLEAELKALQPHEPTPQLKQRVADRLATAEPVRSRWLWGLAIAGGLAAACLAVALWRSGIDPGVKRQPVQLPRPLAVQPIEGSHPTVWEYRLAALGSSDELDSLLNKHATLGEAKPEVVQVGIFTRSDAQLHSLLGEL